MNISEQRQSQMENAFNQIKFNPKFHFPTASKSSNIEAFAHLKATLEAGGAQFKAFELRYPDNAPRGLFALHDLKEGETIMSIPLCLTLKTTKTSQLTISPEAQHIPDRMFNIASASKNDLFDFITLEDQQCQEDYQGYIHLLPDSYTNSPIFFNTHFLNNTGFGQYIINITNALKIDYISLIAEGKTNIPIDIFFWNYMSLQSRFFNFKNDLYMVPILDLCNHSNERLNCKFKFDPDTDTIHYFTLRDIKKDEELLFSYNKKLCPMRSLMFYNMFPEDIILQERNLIYYYVGNKKYEFGHKTAESVLQLIEDAYALNNTSYQGIIESLQSTLTQEVLNRQATQQDSLKNASSDWEKKVIQFTYKQEITEYTKITHLLTQLQLNGHNTEQPTFEMIKNASQSSSP